MESDFITIGFLAQPKAFFNTENGGQLHVVLPQESDQPDFKPAIVMLAFALGLEPECEDSADRYQEWDICHCRIQIADSAGNLWEAKSLFSTDTLLRHIEDLSRGSWAHQFERTTEEIKQAFQTRPLLTGIRGFYDDRCYRRLILDDQIHEVLFKYQYPYFDIAFLEDPHRAKDLRQSMLDRSKLLVRVSNFRSDKMEEIPPFVYEVDCEALIFYSEAQGLPIPLVFKQVGASEQKQSLIQSVPIENYRLDY